MAGNSREEGQMADVCSLEKVGGGVGGQVSAPKLDVFWTEVDMEEVASELANPYLDLRGDSEQVTLIMGDKLPGR
jgi:hypothetical protein